MKTRFLIIIGISIIVFLLTAVVYPTINYKTWGNNELHYTPFSVGTKIICDEWLWQPPQNCRHVSTVTHTNENSDTILSKESCMTVYQQSLDNSLHLDEYRNNFVVWLTECNENEYLQETDVDFYLDTHYSILDMTCKGYAGISPRFTSDLERYAADIKYDECNPDENWLEFKYGDMKGKNEN